MAVELVTAFRTKCSKNTNKHLPETPVVLSPRAHYLIIRLPSSEILKLCTRLLALALVVASLLTLGSLIENSPFMSPSAISESAKLSTDSLNLEHLSLFFRDLNNEGLMKKTGKQKAIFLSSEENLSELHQIVTENNMDVISVNDMEKQSSIMDETIDFIFTYNFPATSKFIDRTLKTGGIVTVLLKDNPSAAFYKPSNYKMAYMRRFDLTAVAMRKMGFAEEARSATPTQRKLLEAKKAALQQLEDVLLEPPRAASKRSSRYSKRTKYLPDLMGDSLENYPRRVFIDVGPAQIDGSSGTDWFLKHYPTRNKKFEMYKIQTEAEESLGMEPQIGMSDWLKKTVKDEEFVVMKAEAEVMEEMVRSKAIALVDELFLECKPQSGQNRKLVGKSRSQRAYWECLALYGRLRDEGVAVHQWWG